MPLNIQFGGDISKETADQISFQTQLIEEYEELVNNNPFEKGDGHDSAVLKATPNPEDPSVDRTNTVTGNFSAVLAGSRNIISEASESIAAGGKLIITRVPQDQGGLTDGGDNALFGYNEEMVDAEDCFIGGGYKNNMKHVKTSGIIGGRENKINPDNGAYLTEYVFIGGGRKNYVEKTNDGEIPNYSAIVGGLENIVRGAGAFIGGGKYNRASYTDSAAFGCGAITTRECQFTCGSWVKSNTSVNTYFAVGCGTDESHRNNCFEVGYDSSAATADEKSSITIGTTSITEAQLKALLALI